MSQGSTGQRIELFLAVFHHLNLLATYDLAALKADEDVRHADVREDLVVHAPRTRRIFVERTQIAVQPVSAAYARHQGQVGRSRTEPGFGVLGLHADLHVVADLGTREDQVFQHQFFGNAQVLGHTLVALELGTVAAHAIVGEGTRAVLHGGLVGQVDIDLVQMYVMTAGSEGKSRQRSKYKCSK
ncbi:hypothetical protein D3C76_1061860 [compost metagenome]